MADKLEQWLVDPRTSKTACDKILALCKKDSRKNKKNLLSIGAMEKLLRALNVNSREAEVSVSLCAAIAQLTGAGEGAQRAAKSEAIPALVRAMKLVSHSFTKPLMDMVSRDPDLAADAISAGAKEEWFTYGEGDDVEDEDEGRGSVKGGLKRGGGVKNLVGSDEE